jgi:hypothetical protein
MEEYENMTVAELKELLRGANLPVSGKKSELIARLVESNDSPQEVNEDVEVEDVEMHEEDDDIFDDDDERIL